MIRGHVMHAFCFAPCAKRQVWAQVATCASILFVLLAPSHVRGQCQPADTTKVAPSKTDGTNSKTPQFYDEPQFTVAGVADATNLGGHGSDTVVRTKEALAKDTVSLGKPVARAPSALSSEEEKLLRNAIDRDSRNLDANYKLGKLLAANGKPAEAVRYIERAAELSPSDAELHHLLGEVEEKLKRPLEAVREYQRAAELNPSEPYLFDWGTELLTHRAPEAAIEVFAKGNRLFPTSVRMLVGLGVAWHARGSYEKAAECVCAASDLDPSNTMPYLFLAKMQATGTIRSPAVLDRLARFARLHPEDALANYYYASALWKGGKGMADEASAAQVQSLLERAVHLDPKLGLAYLLRGIVDSDIGDWSKVISAYRQAIEASPQLEEAHYRLAQAYRRVGEKAKAHQELQLYEQLSRKATEKAERERREIQQFVVALRDAKPGPAQPAKP